MTDVAPDEVVDLYYQAGLGYVFPLTAGTKFPPPSGVTGRHPEITGQDAEIWLEERAYGNFGLRMPKNVIGVDLDAYKGGEVHDWLKPYLPRAWRSTSKGGRTKSAVYFFLGNPELADRLRDKHLGPQAVEVIRHRWRYIACWPSIHPSGDQYLWYAPGSSEPTAGPPGIDEFPAISDEDLELALSTIVISKTGKSTSLTASAPRPKIGTHELGSLKAVMAGYQVYDQRPSQAMAKARVEYERDKIQQLIEELAELASGPDAWEPSVGALALRLFSIALAPWTNLSVEEANELVLEHGPTCDKARAAGAHSHAGGCWGMDQLAVRAARSLENHDGAWAQLPGHLRAGSLMDEAEEFFEDEEDFSGLGSAVGDDADPFDEAEDEPVAFLHLTRSLGRQIRPRAIMDGILYAGVLNIVTGAGGLGKSTVVQAICAEAGPTLWLSTEEPWGAVHDRALVLGSDAFWAPDDSLTISRARLVYDFLDENPEVRHVVIDNLQAFFQLGSDSYNNNVVRDALHEFYRELAVQRGMTLIGISHPPKDKSSSVQGSSAWTEVARHVIKMHRFEDEDSHVLALTVDKSNLHTTPFQSWPVAIQTVEIPIPAADGIVETTSRAAFISDIGLAGRIRDALGGAEADARSAKNVRAKQRQTRVANGLPPIDNPESLITGIWVEIPALAGQLQVPVSKLRALLNQSALAYFTGGSNRLAMVCQEDQAPDLGILAEPADHDLGTLMSVLGVEQVEHLLWLASDHGLKVHIEGDSVSLRSPEAEAEIDALREAGLEEEL